MTAATHRRPGRPRTEELDAAIIDATIDELVERGFESASMESIAARAGVAKTTVYRRWPSITELTVAAMITFEDPAVEPPDGSVRDQLVWLVDRMRGKWSQPRYAAMMRRVAADGTNNPDAYKRARDRIIGPHVRRMNAVLHRAVDEGAIRAEVDVDFVRQLLVAPIMARALTLKERVTRAQVEFTVDTVLAGLTPSAQ